VKKYVAAVAGKEKETQDETQFTAKIGGKNQFGSQVLSFCVKFSFPVLRFHSELVDFGFDSE
jgi:hypothetical protein